MVTSCSAYGCNERFKKGSGVSFHQFPADLDRRRKWIRATKRQNFQPSDYSCLCSKHFVPSDYGANTGSARLLPTSVPSIFNYPEDCEEKLAAPQVCEQPFTTSTDSSLEEQLESTSSTANVQCKCPKLLSPKKPYSNAYLRYTRENWNTVAAEHPFLRTSDISKIIGLRWRNLPNKSRKGYRDLHIAEQIEYNKKLNALADVTANNNYDQCMDLSTDYSGNENTSLLILDEHSDFLQQKVDKKSLGRELVSHIEPPNKPSNLDLAACGFQHTFESSSGIIVKSEFVQEDFQHLPVEGTIESSNRVPIKSEVIENGYSNVPVKDEYRVLNTLESFNTVFIKSEVVDEGL